MGLSTSPRTSCSCFKKYIGFCVQGGRLQFADIVLDKELPAVLACDVESWAQ